MCWSLNTDCGRIKVDDIDVVFEDTAALDTETWLRDLLCFQGFNKEMEEIAKVQRSYSIPDVELRESLKRDNKEYILPKYHAFYEKWG